jgi:hypothetical protein
MRKRLMTIGFVVALTIGIGGPVHQAAAAPNENANCVGRSFQPQAQEGGDEFGAEVSNAAQTYGGIGWLVGNAASTNNCGD